MLAEVVAQLVAVRRAWNLTPEDVGELVGCTGVTIRKLETGIRVPSVPLLFRWANALGYDMLARQRR